MQLGLFTDSVSDMSFERALDFAVEIGVEAIEIATGGQSPAPHARLEQLLADDRAREGFQRAFDERGLRLEALNCSAWPPSTEGRRAPDPHPQHDHTGKPARSSQARHHVRVPGATVRTTRS
jgi:sugar phosphate isomerase/epimerase